MGKQKIDWENRNMKIRNKKIDWENRKEICQTHNSITRCQGNKQKWENDIK